jgi:hypothetical protein
VSDDQAITRVRGAGAAPAGEAPRSSFAALFSAVMLPMFMGAADQTLLVTATPRIAAELGGLAQTSAPSMQLLIAARGLQGRAAAA